MALPSLIPSVAHPIFVHAPIVLVPLAALLATLRGRLPWAAAAFPSALVLAALTAVVAATTGILEHEAWLATYEGTPRATWVLIHEWLGLALAGALVVLVGTYWLVRRAPFHGWRSWAWPAALWTLTLLVLVTGWYGGAIVYDP